MLSLKPELLKRYKDIVLLLIRHVDKDMVKSSGLTDVLEDTDRAETENQDRSAPEELAKDLEELGPTFIKLGQLLSTRPDLLPEPYLEALERLQDDVEPFDFETVQTIVEDELGVRISTAFERFESEPLAAASLGQVHRAALRDGREVVVKVQRPNIRGEVATDLEALGEVAAMVAKWSEGARRYRIEEVLDQFRQTLTQELDYKREAANLTKMAETLAEYESILVPAPIDDYTTSRVLTMEYIDGTKISSLNKVVHTELPGAMLAEELFQAYLYQVLVVGTFHADPHPGNILLTRDHNVALLDLGMIGHVNTDDQQALLRLLLAISQGDGDDASTIALEIADPSDDRDEITFRRKIGELIATYVGAKIGEVQIGRLLIEVCRVAATNGVMLPPSMSVLAKTLLNLDQIGQSLDPNFDPNAAVRRYSEELMSERLEKDFSKEKILASLWEVKDLIEELPSRANRILETLAKNELRIDVDAIDEERLTQSVEKVANRITVGLILAALIVGASLIMRVETSFKIFGYPGLAMLFFMVAAGGALWQVWNILREE